MKANMGTADKIIRILLAIAVVILYYTDQISGTAAIILLIVAGIFILTSIVGFCPIYRVFGISSNKKKSNKMPEDFYTTNQLQILSQKYGIGKDILEKSLDINKLVSEKSFVEFIYLGKNYRGQTLNILTEETELLGVKNKNYLELDIEGEKNAFLLSEIRNIKKI